MDTDRATRRQWLGLAVLALPTLLLSVDVSVLYLALPRLSADLGADSTQQLWILDIYSFMLAGFLVTMGTLGDRIGRRRLLLIGGAAFGALSVLAAYATSPTMLIVARALLGIAGATLMPSTMSLIRTMFRHPAQLGVAIGIWSACFMGGMTLGSLVGGALLDAFWWGSAFLLGVPFMVLLLVAGPLLLPEYRDRAAGRVDLVSVVLSLAAILPVVYGVKQVAREGWAPVPTAAILAGLGIGVMFVRRQGRLAHPLLDLRLFANRLFGTALGVSVALGVVMAGVTLTATLYLQTVRGLPPLSAGLWLVPQNIAMALGVLAAPIIARRVRPAVLMSGGLIVAAAGLGLATRAGDLGVVAVVTGLTLTAGGIAPTMALSMNLLMGATPPEKAGSAAALSETSGEFGVAVGVALLGSLAGLVYRTHLTIPPGTPEQAADAAQRGITEVGTAAARLPATLAADLIDAARSAFTSGLVAVAALGAAVFAVLALLVAIAFRRVPPTDTPTPSVPAPPDRAGAETRRTSLLAVHDRT